MATTALNRDVYMTDEEKAATAAAEAQKAQEADAKFEAGLTELSDEEKEAKRAERQKALHPDNSIDYKAEAEKERLAREKAEQALATKRFKDSEAKRIADEALDSEDEQEEKPLTAREVQSILAEERQQTQKVLQAGRIAELAGNLASSEAEKEYIVEVVKSRTFPAHFTLEEQVEEAYVIANRKKIVGENIELKRALKGKEGVNRDAASTFHDESKPGEPQMAASDKQVLVQSGFTWNSTARRYQKKLASGKLLIRDAATGKVYLEGLQRPQVGQ